MARRAVAVGINYVGTPYELRGCINDADDWAKLLAANAFDVSVLAEKEATRKGILLALGRLVHVLRPGDVGAFTYSGHGTWVPDRDGDEADGRDEAVCPIDMGDDGENLILDDELAEVYGRLAPGATLVVAFDSCHSGTAQRALLDKTAPKPRFIHPAQFGLPADRLARAAAAAPRKAAPRGLAYFAGCADDQFSNDAWLGGRACGAFSHHAVPAFRKVLAAGGTYADVYAEVRRHLPCRDFPHQTPQFAAADGVRAAKVFA